MNDLTMTQEIQNMQDGQEMRELYAERYELAIGRIREVREEATSSLTKAAAKYFAMVSEFLLMIDDTWQFVQEKKGLEQADISDLAERNQKLFADVLPNQYETSFANPVYADQVLGREYGPFLATVYTELRSCIGFVYEGDLEEVVIRMELFLELYFAFLSAAQELQTWPKLAALKEIFYWFASDYAETAAMKRIRALVCDGSFAEQVIAKSEKDPIRALYAYGCYISENEVELARFMEELPEETIATMADTYTEGYRIGFVMTGKDLSKKKVAELRYPVGMERMMRRAIANLQKMQLFVSIHRPGESLLYNPSLYKSGFVGGNPNRQYDFDHKDDRALVLDKNYVNRLLEVTGAAFEAYKEQAYGYAGPAVVESFGEAQFDPENKEQAFSMSKEQNQLLVEYRTKAGQLQRKYIIEEERSFTIIAFPTPEITASLPNPTREGFAEFFREIIRVNTLPYEAYRDVQQILIDALDQADYVEISGQGENRTKLTVNLWKLKDPSKETIFENCVADVNIPVGEVFTSPVLEGTNGVLHVTRVYLNELEFRNLEITFTDGKISGYSCSNFETEAENKAFIEENILFRHDTLPIGEFAIGTNTTAYVVARKYGVEDKLPILIAEKTGPHFAVGDTCYSHAEEIRVYNPDGKEIVAKENSCSLLRDSDPAAAYFNCHTDITIPYEELGELTAVSKDGRRTVILQNGRFVLPGTQMLNEAFSQLQG